MSAVRLFARWLAARWLTALRFTPSDAVCAVGIYGTPGPVSVTGRRVCFEKMWVDISVSKNYATLTTSFRSQVGEGEEPDAV